MANTEIDSLSLEIQIKGLDEKKIQGLDKLSKAVARLSKALKDANFDKLKDIKVPKGLKDINIISQTFKEGSFKGLMSNDLSEAQKEFESFNQTLDDTKEEFDEDATEIAKDSKIVTASAVATANGVKKAKEEIDGKKEPSGFVKFLGKLDKVLKRIKLIAFIKMIRAVLNAIAKGIKEGITNLAGFDKEFNDTMSKMKTAWTTISNSFGLIFRPILETIQPAITQISQAMATLGNEVSKIQASMKGASTYTKVSAKYMDDFAKSSQKATLFSFDTFNTLNTDDSSGMFETEELTEEDKQTSDLRTTIAKIQELLTSIISLVKTLLKFVINLLNKLLPAINIIMDFVSYLLDTITPFLDEIFEALDPLLDAILKDLLPALLGLVEAILIPILDIVKALMPVITVIVDVVARILAPAIKVIAELLNLLSPIIYVILEVVNWIVEGVALGLTGALKMVGDLLEPIAYFFDWIASGFRDFATFVTDFFRGDFTKLGEDLYKLFMNFISGIGRFFVSMIDGVINFVIDGINTILSGFNWIFEKLGWDWHWGITWRSDLASKIPTFADGGFVGELWQMNEKGNPEMLYNPNGSGDTAVINQAQLSLAFENAIYNTGLLDAIAKAGIISIDGKYVAQSQNFKNELNRTNPNLNLR